MYWRPHLTDTGVRDIRYLALIVYPSKRQRKDCKVSLPIYLPVLIPHECLTLRKLAIPVKKRYSLEFHNNGKQYQYDGKQYQYQYAKINIVLLYFLTNFYMFFSIYPYTILSDSACHVGGYGFCDFFLTLFHRVLHVLILA